MLPARTLLNRYLTSWTFLALFVIAGLAYAALSAAAQTTVLQWASTDVFNLHHNPVGSLVASAFIGPGALASWLVMISLAMFGANQALGNWRLALVCVAGQVIGTLVSEGIEGYRIAHGLLPAVDALIQDVGPSYVVVSAIVAGILLGSWPARAAAGLGFAGLVFGAHIFSGLTSLDVAPVGHTTAIVTSVLLCALFTWRHRATDQPPVAISPASKL